MKFFRNLDKILGKITYKSCEEISMMFQNKTRKRHYSKIIKVLMITNMYPTEENPASGVFVKEQIDSLKAEGIEIDLIFINGGKSEFEYLKGCWQVFRQSLKNHYDLIHAHYGLSGIPARCQFRSPVIISFCGSDIMNKIIGKISKFLSLFVDACIVKSKELKKRLGQAKAYVIQNGVNLKLFRPIPYDIAKRKSGLANNKKHLLFIGNPKDSKRKEKRFDLAQEAFEIVKRNYNLPIELITIWNEPHDKIPLYMNASDVLLLTSDWEGSPNAVKEAMACNLPIVSVNIGDVKEVIGDTEGCYIAQRDPEDIAKKIEFVLKRNKRTDGREKIKLLSLENVAKRIIDVYKEVTSK